MLHLQWYLSYIPYIRGHEKHTWYIRLVVTILVLLDHFLGVSLHDYNKGSAAIYCAKSSLLTDTFLLSCGKESQHVLDVSTWLVASALHLQSLQLTVLQEYIVTPNTLFLPSLHRQYLFGTLHYWYTVIVASSSYFIVLPSHFTIIIVIIPLFTSQQQHGAKRLKISSGTWSTITHLEWFSSVYIFGLCMNLTNSRHLGLAHIHYSFQEIDPVLENFYDLNKAHRSP